jgi:fructuronate reductase
MVDRIVPATTEDDRHLASDMTGLCDRWPVITEPFTQWVVEDQFTGARPPLERAGVRFVREVRPYELMKLRMLNASHSTIAYLGYLAGYEYVNMAITNPSLRRFVCELMTDEVMQTLPQGLGNLADYRDALIERFCNPALHHRTWQIAMDGSQKLPQRLLGTIRDRLAAGLPITRLSLGVAAWMRYVTGVGENGEPIDVKDPLAPKLRTIADTAKDSPRELVEGLLGVSEVFGTDLARNQIFRTLLLRYVSSLYQRGALATASLVNSDAP